MKVIALFVESMATGVLTIVEQLIPTLVENFGKDKIHLIYSVRKETPQEVHTRFSKICNNHKFKTNKINVLKSIFAFRKLVLKINPTHLICLSSWAGLIGRSAMLWNNNGPLIYYNPQAISFARKDINYITKLIFYFVEKLLLLRTHCVIASGNSEYSYLKKSLRSSKIKTISNPAPTTNKTCSKPPIYDVVFCGGIRPQKDPSTFAHIASILSKKRNNIKILWIGDGCPKLKSILEDNNVTVTGWLEKHSIQELYASSRVYLSCAQWEGLPLSVLEALGSGLPCILYNCTGNQDCVEPGSNGYLFKDPRIAIELIEELLNNNQKFNKFSENSRELAQRRFSHSNFQKSWVEIINED